MRPIRRGASPSVTDFDPYDKAKPDLIARLGPFCSYCERRIPTNLAIEHIQPKNLPAYAPLVGRWDNFLLGCVNCNSSKSDKDVILADVLLPDRDNTFHAFTYHCDGTVVPSQAVINAGLKAKADATLKLVGLDKKISQTLDENGKLVAIDRMAQRLEVWALAIDSLSDLHACSNDVMRKKIAQLALGYGYFSIWVAVFIGDIDMCNRFIDAFSGTRQSGCFNAADCSVITCAPNPDRLPHGGKI